MLFSYSNTYTNKTWSEVSGIALSEINLMEREFLQGVDHALYIDFGTYQRWGKLLGGLLLAKERDKGTWRRRYAAAAAMAMAGVRGGMGQTPLSIQMQVHGYPYPSPPQENLRPSTSGIPNVNNTQTAAASSNPSSRADGLPVHRRQIINPQPHHPQHLAPILPHPSHAYPSSNSNSSYSYRSRERVPSGSGSRSHQRTRARSSSPVLASTRLAPSALHPHHHAAGVPPFQLPLPLPSSQTNGQQRALLHPAQVYQQQHPAPVQEYPFTFALPSNAPQVRAPSSSTVLSEQQAHNHHYQRASHSASHHQQSQQPSVMAGAKRAAADDAEGDYAAPPLSAVSNGHRNNSPPTRRSPSNKVPKLDHRDREMHQQLAQLSIANLNNASLISGAAGGRSRNTSQRTSPSAARAPLYRSGGSTGSPDAISTSPEDEVDGNRALFVDPATSTNVPSGSVVVPPAEPTLQRTLQAPYAHDASKWESRRAIPQVGHFCVLFSYFIRY